MLAFSELEVAGALRVRLPWQIFARRGFRYFLEAAVAVSENMLQGGTPLFNLLTVAVTLRSRTFWSASQLSWGAFASPDSASSL